MSHPVGEDVDLATRVGGLALKNPVIAASGTCGTGVELARACDVSRLGAIVMKTVTPEPRAGNPPARIAETPSGMLNSIGLENPGIERFVEHSLPKARELDVTLIASVAGRRPEDYALCARRLDEAGGIAAIEVNLSCPNYRPDDRPHDQPREDERRRMTPLAFGQDASAAAEVITAVREATRLPVWAKLTSSVADIVAIGRACLGAGADAVVAMNTIPGMAMDVRARRPVLGGVTGGLSGPAIMPVALRCVWELARGGCVSVVGCGGAASARDVAAFLMAGASAVQIGTATFRDPQRASRLAGELRELLAELGAGSVEEITGAASAAGAGA